MVGQFDMFLPKDEQDKFPDPKPILHICDEFGLKPADVLVLARHAPTIKAAKYALLALLNSTLNYLSVQLTLATSVLLAGRLERTCATTCPVTRPSRTTQRTIISRT